MKKSVFVIVLIVFFPGVLPAQEVTEVERVIRNVADRIADHSTFKIINTATGQRFDAADASSGKLSDLKIESEYNEWKYWNGVLNIAFDELGQTLDDNTYRSFSGKNLRFAFDNYPFFEENYSGQGRWVYPFGLMIGYVKLDDCGAMGASLIQLYEREKRDDYRTYIDNTADYIMNREHTLEDGTLCRTGPEKMTIWGDDLYMSIPFLARMGKLTGEKKYFDFSVLQVKKFNEYLYDPYDELFYHCYYTNFREHGVAYWSRCNGWIIMATVELLKFLPEDHPERQDILDLLNRQVRGLSRYQGATGMWHQLIDKEDSYLESSSTAMFVYCFARAVNEGWIDDRYAVAARKGWLGLTEMITADGQVMNICKGLNIHPDLPGYYNHEAPLNDIHGLGAILLAGSEMIRLLR